MNKLKETWMNDQLNKLLLIYPDNEKQIKKILSKKYDERVEDIDCIIYNNYTNKSSNIKATDLCNLIIEKKPILAGNGTLVRQHEDVYNPFITIMKNFIKKRKLLKAEMFKQEKGSYEFKSFNRKQLTEKLNNNAYYGSLGSDSFFLYNKLVAASTTATGQILIATALNAFEGFMGDNLVINSVDEIINFIKNVLSEGITDEEYILDDIIPEEIINRFEKNLRHSVDMTPVRKILSNLSQEELNIIYYKNNLYPFMKLPKIRKILQYIFSNVKEFRDPNDVPKCIEKEINFLWSLTRKYVAYEHPIFERVQRAKTDIRNTVVVTDTDSTMLNLKPWHDFCKINILPLVKSDVPSNEMDFIIINTLCYLLTLFIEGVLEVYCIDTNITESERPLINMKNEFLFWRLVLASSKKRYLALIGLQEGNAIEPPKVDVKGHDFIKSSTRPETSDFFKKLAKEDILSSETINPVDILQKTYDFGKEIRESLMKGEKLFLSPKCVKEFSAYSPDKLYSLMPVRALLAWSAVYPDHDIIFPIKFDIVKLKCAKLSDIEKLEEDHPDVYKALKNKIFENSSTDLASKGVTVLAIPRDVKSIPEWAIPYIDVDVMVSDNLNKFAPVLSSFSCNSYSTKSHKSITNIISI